MARVLGSARLWLEEKIMDPQPINLFLPGYYVFLDCQTMQKEKCERFFGLAHAAKPILRLIGYSSPSHSDMI